MCPATSVIKSLVIPLESFPCVHSDDTIHDAVGSLFSHTANGSGKLLHEELLVIDRNDLHVGRLNIRGILTCFFPTLFGSGQQDIFAGKQERFTDLAVLLEDTFLIECRRQGTLQVEVFMDPPYKSIKADLHPLHAAEIMMEENVNCLPVVEDDTLIGVVRLIDLFRSLAGSCALQPTTGT